MKKPLKLNLGSGSDKKPGYVNVDADRKTKPDKIWDLRKSLPVKDKTVDEILLKDVLEHLTKEEGESLLRECWRVLREKSQITIRVPNIADIIERFGDDEEVMLEFIYGSTKASGQWGSHKRGFTRETLVRLLKRCGFEQIAVKKETTNFVVEARVMGEKIKPSILIVQQSPDWGGAEEWMASLVDEWRKKGVPITGYTNLGRLQERWRKVGAKVGNIPMVLDITGNLRGLVKTVLLLPAAIMFYAAVLKKAKSSGANLVLMSGFSEKLLVSWLARAMSITVAWYEYAPMGPLFKKHWYLPKLVYRLTKHIPSRVFALSKKTFDFFVSSGRVSTGKLRLIYPGVRSPDIVVINKKMVVGSLSRVTPEKGQRLLVKAWKRVVGKIPEAKLKIAGRGPDDGKLAKMVDELKIETSVELLGFVENSKKLYKSLKLFVFPSIWELEGFGLVMTEAMSYGVPVVAFDNGASEEVINEQVGWLVKERNEKALADAIVKALKDKSFGDKKIKARKLVREKFNLETQAEMVLKELNDAVMESA